MTTMREQSRKDWAGDRLEHINAGSLQRIADAMEKTALRHTELIRERDQYERWHRDEAARRKSQITKLKKRLKAIGEQS